MNNRDIATLNLHDIPAISKQMKYYDGDLYFGDNITSIPHIASVFRLNFLVLVFCLQGHISLRIGDRRHTIKQHDVLFVNSNSIVAIDSVSDDVSCKICALNSQMVFSLINKSLVEAVMQLEEQSVISLSPQEIALMMHYYNLADYKMTHPEFVSHDTVNSILKAFSIDLLSFITQHIDKETAILNQGDKLYRKFLYLVASNVDGHRSVKSYAQDLCVSAKYLTSVCQLHANKSASDIITANLVARIKQMLLYSDLSVKEIASKLNFDNLSFFGKYVKKHLGCSPLNFRKLNNYGV